MQRTAAGPGPLGLQGPPRSLKISPVKLQDEAGDPMSQKGRSSLCVGCGGRIHDQWILRVAPDLEWHAACLKCAACQQFLDESCTCFVRDGKTYCKDDYVRLFGTKCDKCRLSFNKNDFVMRAKTKIYHLECFRCSACMRQLVPGDEFALRSDGLFCRHDHDALEGEKLCGGGVATTIAGNENNNNANLTNNNHHLHPNDGSLSDSGSESGSHKTVGGSRSTAGHKGGGSDGKPTRVRTVLNEKQLHTLRTCYAANPRPDALMKEQLVEMTGLSPRVIRVWFQNKRCKDKKKTIAMKQQMQQEKDGRKLGFGGMHGIPMVASSPVRHESPIGMTPLEVQAYQPPWKALSDFALHTDLDRLDPNAPSFHHLVSQMHGYDMHGGGPPQLPPPGMMGGPMGEAGGGGPLPPPGPHHPGGGNGPGSGPDMGQHPDSTDSYVTYLESDSDSLHHDTGSP
ncbi:PREDICTED: insulin gene enhancer protein ISL-1 [Ceratosolen solmsi marchali]|uniref:Insulin gene enhancer protein ISL-1 n=1 Tax=Ceratosolen solmsi marchali TaxID=326594 RepID=A0AAJ6YGB3_9HYME|nr:PREDICTED: insulin gene enhancer protein ISL-1 [Ceratosolen solmsi marchali]